jgi:hypothetical protein
VAANEKVGSDVMSRFEDLDDRELKERLSMGNVGAEDFQVVVFLIHIEREVLATAAGQSTTSILKFKCNENITEVCTSECNITL